MSLVLEDREYQNRCVAAILDFMLSQRKKKKKHGIAVLPCGAGKSLIAARVILGLDAPAILFQPRKELLIQNEEKLLTYGFQPAVFSASMGRKEIGDVTLATIGSVAKYPAYFEDVKYVLVDEASEVNPKQGQYKDFFKALPDDVIIVGLDATPFRMASNSLGTELRFLTRTVPRIFNEVVYYVQIQELFEAGYLAKPQYFSMHKEVPFDENQLVPNSSGSDCTDESVQRHLFEIGFQEKLASIVQRLINADRRGILVFTRFTKEAEFLAREVPGVAVVTSKSSPDERQDVLDAFKAGDIRTVANVGIAGIGFDYPELDTVVLARHSWSLRVLYQQMGRCIRPYPDKRPKTPYVVDMVGNLKRFGRLEHLTLYCKGKSQWYFAGRPGGGKEVALTNCYLSGSATMPTCKRCKSSDFFYSRHFQTGNSAMLSRAPEGMAANILLMDNPNNPQGAKVYAIRKPTDLDYKDCEFLNHRSVCKGNR